MDQYYSYNVNNEYLWKHSCVNASYMVRISIGPGTRVVVFDPAVTSKIRWQILLAQVKTTTQTGFTLARETSCLHNTFKIVPVQL